MYELQTSVEVNGASFGIRNKGDFRMVLDCFKALNDEELSPTEKIYSSLIIFYQDFNSLEDLFEHQKDLEELKKQMFLFFDCGEENPKSNTNNKRLVDWERDSNLIIPAINNVAHTEIRALSYLHWWTFIGYYMSIGESLFSQVISIRKKVAENKKLDKWEKQFKQENPEYFNIDYRSLEEKAADDYVRQLWEENNNG